MMVFEFENLPEQFNDRNYDEEMMTPSLADDGDHMSSTSNTSLSLLAAIDSNMTRAEFDDLPKETRNILKTIQAIQDDDDISFDSEAANEIFQYISQPTNNNP